MVDVVVMVGDGFVVAPKPGRVLDAANRVDGPAVAAVVVLTEPVRIKLSFGDWPKGVEPIFDLILDRSGLALMLDATVEIGFCTGIVVVFFSESEAERGDMNGKQAWSGSAQMAFIGC